MELGKKVKNGGKPPKKRNSKLIKSNSFFAQSLCKGLLNDKEQQQERKDDRVYFS